LVRATQARLNFYLSRRFTRSMFRFLLLTLRSRSQTWPNARSCRGALIDPRDVGAFEFLPFAQIHPRNVFRFEFPSFALNLTGQFLNPRCRLAEA
jgi:hypothetical protein